MSTGIISCNTYVYNNYAICICLCLFVGIYVEWTMSFAVFAAHESSPLDPTETQHHCLVIAMRDAGRRERVFWILFQLEQTATCKGNSLASLKKDEDL